MRSRSGRRCRFAAGIAALAGWAATAGAGSTASAQSAAATPRPAIESAAIQWLAVSPAYQHTGVVAAVGALRQCAKDCQALWVSRDGGSSWHRAAARHWVPRRLVIAVDSRGHDVFLGLGGTLVSRSDDLGENFAPVGTGGMPTILPSFANDPGAIVVAAMGIRSDYAVEHGSAHDVTGSDHADTDLQFALSPSFPDGGSHSPALLAGVARSGRAVVLRCTADFNCANPVSMTPSTSLYAPAAATSLTVSPDYVHDGTVFVDTTGFLEKSTDGGLSFTPLSVVPETAGIITTLPMLALAPGYRESGTVRTVYVAVEEIVTSAVAPPPHAPGGIYSTRDGGATWSPLATTGPFAGNGATAVAVAPDGRLFAGWDDGIHGGLACSTDGGSSWNAWCPWAGDHLGVTDVAPSTAAAAAVPSATAAAASSGGSTPWLALVATATVVLGAAVAGLLRARTRRRTSSRLE